MLLQHARQEDSGLEVSWIRVWGLEVPHRHDLLGLCALNRRLALPPCRVDLVHRGHDSGIWLHVDDEALCNLDSIGCHRLWLVG